MKHPLPLAIAFQLGTMMASAIVLITVLEGLNWIIIGREMRKEKARG